MTPAKLIVLPAMLLSLLACRAEPELNCERVRFGWPHFDEGPSSDVSEAEGIQINIPVRSDLIPGARATLTITDENLPEEEREAIFAAEAYADKDGQLVFENVTIPIGSILFLIDAEDACGRARTGRRTFVWDGLGRPQCELALALLPEPDPSTGSFDLVAEHDEEPGTPGMQVTAQVNAGRSDMDVKLFVVDRETGDTQNFDVAVDSVGEGEQAMTLAEGEQAVRADCYWPTEDLHVTTPTRVYFVDSTTD